MALSHAILVTLLDKPQTGYELSKRFDRTVGFFWRASHQQIYGELHKLAARGLVDSVTEAQQERPNRIVYSITDAGRAAVDQWVADYTPAPSFKEELLVRLFALDDRGADAQAGHLRRRLDEHRQRLAHYRAVMAEYYPDPSALDLRRRGRYLGLRMGILTEETGIRWCEEALALLAAD